MFPALLPAGAACNCREFPLFLGVGHLWQQSRREARVKKNNDYYTHSTFSMQCRATIRSFEICACCKSPPKSLVMLLKPGVVSYTVQSDRHFFIFLFHRIATETKEQRNNKRPTGGNTSQKHKNSNCIFTPHSLLHGLQKAHDFILNRRVKSSRV